MSSLVEPLESRALFADFSVAFTSTTIPDSVKAGDKLKGPAVTFTVSESGDLTKDQGKAKLTLDVSITSNGQTLATGKQAKITASQLAKKPKAVKFAFSTLKVAPAAGTYTLTATLGGALTTAGDSVSTNNTAATTLTVASSGSTGGGTSNPFAASQVDGSVFTFTGKKTNFGGINSESGTFKTDAGETGSYKIDFGTGAGVQEVAALLPDAGAPIRLEFHPNSGSITTLNKKKFTFGVAESEATGYVNYAGTKVFYK